MNLKLPIAVVALVIAMFLIVSYLAFFQKRAVAPTSPQTFQSPQASPAPEFQASDEILKNALNLYIQKRQENLDFSTGPCLGKIADDWVLDIAHNPRQDIDNKSENQCPDFLAGRAHHFVEFDPQGNLIKAE